MSRVQDVIIEETPETPGSSQEETVAVDQPDGLPTGVVATETGFRLDLDWPVVMRFKTGDQIREEKFVALNVRRMTGADLRAMMTNERQDGAMLLLERIIELPTGRAAQVIDRMDASDLMRGLALVAFLGPKSQKTGP